MDYNSLVCLIKDEDKIKEECFKSLAAFNRQATGTQIECGRKAAVLQFAQEELHNRTLIRLTDLGMENNVLREENEYLLTNANLIDKAYIDSVYSKHRVISSTDEARNAEMKKQINVILGRLIKHVK